MSPLSQEQLDKILDRVSGHATGIAPAKLASLISRAADDWIADCGGVILSTGPCPLANGQRILNVAPPYRGRVTKVLSVSVNGRPLPAGRWSAFCVHPSANVEIRPGGVTIVHAEPCAHPAPPGTVEVPPPRRGNTWAARFASMPEPDCDGLPTGWFSSALVPISDRALFLIASDPSSPAAANPSLAAKALTRYDNATRDAAFREMSAASPTGQPTTLGPEVSLFAGYF